MEDINPLKKDPAGINACKALKRAQYDENGWIKSAHDFHYNNVFLSKRVAMEKYKEYLDRISFIKIDYLEIHREDYSENGWLFIRKCEKDLRLVFEMSQKDNRLTKEEKQEVVDYIAKRYTFVLSAKNFE
jgi:ABC-type molybdate transport system substrate-binding protein